jgi:hypothetical protein
MNPAFLHDAKRAKATGAVLSLKYGSSRQRLFGQKRTKQLISRFRFRSAGASRMNKQRTAVAVVAVLVVGAVVLFAYQRLSSSGSSPRNDLLSQMPADASAVLYIDLNALRQSPFLAELYKWAPQPKADADYTQFLQSTGFNYERDLDRVSVALLKHGQESTLLVVAEGRFDRKKIAAYASPTGTRETRGGREIFSMPVAGGTRRIVFTFLRNDRIALTNDASLESSLFRPRADSDSQAWGERFRRLAGSPVFVVVRQDAGAGAALSPQAPGGLQSPQLSALIDQLQWITVGGKPEADHLRVVVEGEGGADAPTKQLSDVISGLLVLAQAGLNDQKLRQQLQPDVREAYLELLKSADVSRIDRGETKSVRLMFDLTPKFLEAARTPTLPASPEDTPKKPSPSKSTIRN